MCIDSLLNKDLVKLVSDQVANLEYGVNLLRKSSADETKKISYALQNVRCEFDKHLGDLLEKVEKVEERVEKGEKRVEKVEGQVEKGEERVEKIEERVEKGEERVEKVEERVEKGKEKVERVEERLEKGEKRVEKVQQRVEKGEERVEKVEERVEKGKERVEKVEEQMSDMKFRQEELEAAMSSMKDSHNIYNVTNSAKVVPLQVPSRNPYFCGRDNELGAITAVLKGAERGCAQLAICGLGGVGKTSLTVEFLWRCKEEYQGGIFWISGESNTLFQSSFCELAHQIGTFIQNDFPSTLSKTLDWLQRQHHLWCLVVDNLDEADLSEELRKLLRGKWKQRAHGNIIITTRRETRQVAEVLGIEERCCVDLYCLTEEDSIQFLRKRTERAKGEDSEIRELIGLLGALPLALDQAAAYIRCVRCSLKDYVEQYKKQKLLLLKKKEARDVEETTSRQRLAVHTTWLMNFEHIKNNQSYEQSVREATNLVMEVSAFLCPDEIPFEMINEGLPPIDDESGITDVLREPLGRDEILSLLTEFSLFQRCGTNSFRVHRLVQEVIRGRLDRVREKFVFSCAKSFLMKAEQCTPLSEKAHLALSKNKFYIDRKEFTDKLDETSDQFAMLDEKKQESENACPSGKKGEKKREGMLPWFFKKDGKRKAKARLEIHCEFMTTVSYFFVITPTF